MNYTYKVGIYLRLSKEDEKLGESGSITNQRAILLNYIKENNLYYVCEYVDDGVSGTTFNRIGFNKMIKDIEDKKINMVITKDTSRLGRDHIEFGYYVEKYFPEHNVRYVAVCDNIDTFYNNNDMLLFKSAYNDMYVKDISNKIRASLNIKKKNGEFVGAYAPYGYIKDSNNKHKLIIDEEAAEIVRRIFKLFIEGNSISKIANILTDDKISIPSVQKNMNRGLKSELFGIWTSRTIRDILINPTYMGNLTQGRSRKINYKTKKRIHTKEDEWIVTKGTVPAIIDEKIFCYAQTIYKANKNKQNSKKSSNLLLKGIIFCLECDHTIGFREVVTKTKKSGNKRIIYGNCNYYLKNKRYHVCTPHSIKYFELENVILEQIRSLTFLIDKEKLYNSLVHNNKLNEDKFVQKEKNNIKYNIKLEQKKLDNLYEDKLSGFISCEKYLYMDKLIQEKIVKLQEKLDKIIFVENEPKIEYQNYFEKIYQNYLTSKSFILSLVDKILVSEEGKIEIYYNIKV